MLKISEARKLKGSFVYALADDRGVFYVGQTRRPSQRFRSHANGETPNRQLRARCLKADDALRVMILHENPDDLNAAELSEIKARDGLLNLVGNGWDFTYSPEAKPWALKGISSPGQMALRWTKEPEDSPIRKRLKAMTDARRCLYEINLLSSFPEPMRRRFDKWMDRVRCRMVECIEAEYGPVLS
jgi:predicted GIY-YIG superfamily endonuclease